MLLKWIWSESIFSTALANNTVVHCIFLFCFYFYCCLTFDTTVKSNCCTIKNTIKKSNTTNFLRSSLVSEKISPLTKKILYIMDGLWFLRNHADVNLLLIFYSCIRNMPNCNSFTLTCKKLNVHDVDSNFTKDSTALYLIQVSE